MKAPGQGTKLGSDWLTLAYVTVANVVRGLEDKGFLKQLNKSRPFQYCAAQSFEDVSKRLVGDLVERLQKLMATLHEAAEYEVVGVDPSVQPVKVRLRMGVTPRKGVAAEEVLKAMSAVIEASHEEADEDSEDAEEPLDESKEEILRFLSIVKPKIRKSSDPSLPSAVMLEGNLNPSALWITIGG